VKGFKRESMQAIGRRKNEAGEEHRREGRREGGREGKITLWSFSAAKRQGRNSPWGMMGSLERRG
jgi:hypothetical protein